MSIQQADRVSDFVRLTKPHQRNLYGVALALCRDPDQAADLTQETLIKAYKAFDGFHRDEPIVPWLRRILRNTYLDTFKTGRARHEVLESNLGDDRRATAVETHDPLAILEEAERSRCIREEIARLDPAHGEILTLCVMQELSFAEAAELTGLPVGTVASRLARARAQLRERMLKRATIARREEEKSVPSSRIKDSAREPSRTPIAAKKAARGKKRHHDG